MHGDAEAARHEEPLEPFTPDGKLTFSKVAGVFKSGNTTRDTIPTHLVAGPEVPAEMARFYNHVCPESRLPGGSLRGGRRAAAHQRAELRRLQGNRCAGAALDPARGREWTEVQADVSCKTRLLGSSAHNASWSFVTSDTFTILQFCRRPAALQWACHAMCRVSTPFADWHAPCLG